MAESTYSVKFREYAEAIWEIEEEGIEVIQARVADWLGVSRASVSEMQQVFLNLINNAIDAMEKTGGKIHISIRIENHCLVIRVADTGPGVPESERQRIFEAFHSTRGESHGGLGLSISRRIVEEAGGSLRVEDAPGGGARFRIELPEAP